MFSLTWLRLMGRSLYHPDGKTKSFATSQNFSALCRVEFDARYMSEEHVHLKWPLLQGKGGMSSLEC